MGIAEWGGRGEEGGEEDGGVDAVHVEEVHFDGFWGVLSCNGEVGCFAEMS